MPEAPEAGTVALAWAHALVDALCAAGLGTVVVAPGSRSSPLVLAAADHDGLETHSLLDERSAAYFALGRARVTGTPTAVVTTSGTATANCHPAVVEADASRVPLLVLTADRPPELLDSGANQTIDQVGLYGDAPRWQRTLGEPAADDHRLRSVRAVGARAVAEATGPPAGPVHVNVPFRKPLQPPSKRDREAARTLAAGETPGVTPPALAPPEGPLHALAARIAANDRGMIVVGPAGLDDDAAAAVGELAAATGMPVLADPASGLRFRAPEGAVVCGGYDGYIDVLGAHLGSPELVLRVGPPPTSKALRTYLAAADPTQVLLDHGAAWRDADFRLDSIVRGDPATTARRLLDALEHAIDPGFAERFDHAEDAYWSVLDDTLRGEYFEGAIANAVAAAAPRDTLLFAGNSMPIRDLDRFGEPRAAGPRAVANRGASGIDGTVSTALGAAHAADRSVIALVGDLAAYHDMNGLLAVERLDVDATIVVVNNDGGGIFHMLPIAAHDPPFSRLFKTPHGLDFAAAAAQYGLDHTPVHGRTDLAAAVLAIEPGRRQLIECHVDAERSHRTRERLAEDIRDAFRAALSGG